MDAVAKMRIVRVEQGFRGARGCKYFAPFAETTEVGGKKHMIKHSKYVTMSNYLDSGLLLDLTANNRPLRFHVDNH